MPVPGIGAFPQGGKFCTPRQLTQRFAISGILGVPVQSANQFFFPGPVLPNEDYYITVHPDFWDWHSRMWSIEKVVLYTWRVVNPDPTEIPVNYSLQYFFSQDALGAHLLYIPYSVSTPPRYFSLPPPASGYWLPPL